MIFYYFILGGTLGDLGEGWTKMSGQDFKKN